MTDFAIYDMDRTVTRRATYTPFLVHCAWRRAPWRLLFLPLVVGSMLAYLVKLIDRGRLKEINHRLLIGHKRHPHELKPLVESFARKVVASNVRPGAIEAIARDKAEGRRIVMATASYRFYSMEIAELLGFDDCIGTNSILGPRPCQDRRRKLLRACQAQDDQGLAGEERAGARPCPLLFRSRKRPAGVRMVR